MKKKINSDFILIYAPYRGEPWILNKLINDIKLSSSNANNYKIFNSLKKLSFFKYKHGGHVFSMHQSNLRKLYLSGIPLKEISTYYTHSRINQDGICKIKKIRRIFCQNDYELSLLKSSGISESKLINFPIGIHDNFLKDTQKINNLEKREIDIIFCLRYYTGNYHYSIRKRYEFILNLSNILSEINLKVCILGKGWKEQKSFLNSQVLVEEVPFKEYSKFYRNSKIYCNPSLCEGGPISLIEAFASGCIIYTSPVGLSFNYCINDELSFLVPFGNDEVFWQQSLIKSLQKNYDNNLFKEILNQRYKKLNKSTFNSLAKVLESNIV